MPVFPEDSGGCHYRWCVFPPNTYFGIHGNHLQNTKSRLWKIIPPLIRSGRTNDPDSRISPPVISWPTPSPAFPPTNIRPLPIFIPTISPAFPFTVIEPLSIQAPRALPASPSIEIAPPHIFQPARLPASPATIILPPHIELP